MAIIMRIVLVSLNIDNKIKDILNYDPIYYPIGLSCLAPILVERGLDVKLFDVNLFISKKEIFDDFISETAKEIVSSNPSYIGFYTRSDVLPRVILCANKIKALNPNITIILGGPGVFQNEYNIMNTFKEIDIIIRNEGEAIINELFLNGEIRCDLHNVKGITYRDNKQIIENKNMPLIESLDNLPFPMRILAENSSMKQDEYIFIEAGRGCPYNCNFCTTSMFWDRKYRLRSPKKLLDEMEFLNQYGYNKFSLIHDNLLVSEDYVLDLSKEFKRRNLVVEWSCSTRVDNINENKIKLVKECGCTKIYFGIESGSDKIQKIIGKNIKTDIVEYAISLCAKYGIYTTKSFIIGFEEETVDDINDTISLAIKVLNCEYNQEVQLHYLQPSPGTRVTKNRSNNLVINNDKEIFAFLNREEPLSNPKELELIKTYPDIFSDFYHIKTNQDIDLCKVVLCFSHLLFYYPKTLNIICVKKSISPIDLFGFIHKHCLECHNCIENIHEYASGGNGFCKEPLMYIEGITSLSSIDRYLIAYETERRNKIK